MLLGVDKVHSAKPLVVTVHPFEVPMVDSDVINLCVLTPICMKNIVLISLQKAMIFLRRKYDFRPLSSAHGRKEFSVSVLSIMQRCPDAESLIMGH